MIEAAPSNAATATSRGSLREMLFVAVICLLLLLPFAGKAYHADDPLFVWSGQQIQRAPLDFYGFDVNWYGETDRMFRVTHNPPLFSYLLAIWAAAFGWSEPAGHALVFLLAALTAMGVHRLARSLGAAPRIATIVAVASPVFFVSATTVMCDVLMLCAWVWALALWLRGVELRSAAHLVGGALCVAVAALTKYFAISLLPLLLVYTLMQRRVTRRWALLLLLPLLAVVGFELASRGLYGQGLIGKATADAATIRDRLHVPWVSRTLTTFSFAGGCVLPLLFLAPLLWRRGTALVWLVVGGGVAAGLVVGSGAARAAWLAAAGDGFGWPLWLQVGLFVAASVLLFALTLGDLVRRRDAEALLLALWVVGTFVGAGFLHHFVAARFFLPLAPAAGILVGRRLASRAPGPGRAGTWPEVTACAMALSVALFAAWADHRLAGSARAVAAKIPGDGMERTWFQGHWGFQYYMQLRGARPVDFARSRILAGDTIVIPLNNTNIQMFDAGFVASQTTFEQPVLPFLASMNAFAGAGFYSDIWGPAPFAFARVPPERYYLVRIKAP